jgi:hypothetical protein
MKDFANELVDLIIQNETPRLNNIMQEVSKKIQNDVIQKTYEVVDKFYQDYTRADGRVYIRVDEYRATPSKRRDKRGNRLVRKRDRNVSLRSAITNGMMRDDEGAVGVCRPLDGVFGWEAGVLFDEGYFQRHMKHSYKGSGFTEWDIVQNFLSGIHGDESIAITEPSAGYVLNEFIENYESKFDKHYQNACKKFIK